MLARSTKFNPLSTSHNSLPFPQICHLSTERQLGRFSYERTGSILSLIELLSVSSIITLHTRHINIEDCSRYIKKSPALYTK